jgi:low affinity Fe/Cu permease
MDNKFKDFSRKLTRWIGSPQSIVLHTIFFIGIFALRLFGFSSSDVLLILTTIVSLEAIYLSIFIQMTVNKHAEELEEVSEDIEEIQEDVDEIQKDVDEIQEDVEEIQEDVDEIQEEVVEEENETI